MYFVQQKTIPAEDFVSIPVLLIKILTIRSHFFLYNRLELAFIKTKLEELSQHISQSERLGERNSNGKALAAKGPNKTLDQEFHTRNIDRNSST